MDKVAALMSLPSSLRRVDIRSTVEDALVRLRDSHCDALLVVNGDDVVGAVTDRELRGFSAAAPLIEAVGAWPPVLSPSHSLAQALEHLEISGSEVAVVLAEGRLSGLITLGQLAPLRRALDATRRPTRNLGGTDRALRLGLGLALAAVALGLGSPVVLVTSLYPTLTAVVGWCPVYFLVGASTRFTGNFY